MTKSADSFRLEDVLTPFRAMESNEDAIPILGDEDAMKCLSAWSKTDQVWRRPKRPAPKLLHDNHAAVWAWMVAGWDVDFNTVAMSAGVSPRTAHEKMTMLVRNRLVYPDGSMAKGARTAMNLYVADKLGLKQRPQPKPGPQKLGDDTQGN